MTDQNYINHIALVLDASASMTPVSRDLIKVWITEENARTYEAMGRTFMHCIFIRTVTTVTTAVKIIDA